jgi:uncharacterized protein YggE
MTVAHVRGSSGVEVTPDRARLIITVRGVGATDLAATESYNTGVRSLRDVLAQHGLEAQVEAPRSWESSEGSTDRVVVGTASVEVDDLETVRFLSGYLASSEGVSLRWVRWLVSNWQEARRRARKDAVASARVAAEDFADALGMEVEAIESISDPGVGGYDEDYGDDGDVLTLLSASGEDADDDEDPPMVDVSGPKAATISATVHATYRLRPAG